ncbi:hypothetical protein H6G80_23960 [Nostoc sp. FACHB-87]|uniref:hypothetical protein n=1 Tax=Nostocales TaxID=1161 RepID=UPI0016874125|nr:MULTISPECIES: hypothetical protein [Nostocales]MBD2302501.1 hypothetical protein [Nostoc sp. FACHB-190]MBD2457117.1 hypothetical protein [Nostoc sp. FACHB-87]MBD2477017.1 hypothetical protein [Anabaena sp. FACHB-83]MBD2490614.1 hypothetical protein [Aulosira sp. FACHB-615]
MLINIVVEQKRQIERLGKSLKEIYLPLKTSDTLVVEYRKWLDKFGQGLPFYQGYDSEKNFHSDELQENSLTLDRLSQHTQICSSCNQVYRVTNFSKQIFIGVAIALAALAILTDNSWVKPVAVVGGLLAIILAFAAQQLKTKFERAYTRH